MIIYTGYFGGLKKYKYPNPISIALKPPDYWTGDCAKWLAPQNEWFWKWKNSLKDLTNKNAIEEYSRLFFQTTLRGTSPQEIIDRLGNHLSKEDCTLLCFEKAPIEKIVDIDTLVVGKDFCHRHLISQYLRNCGFESYELMF
jgi:hypothetical protein